MVSKAVLILCAQVLLVKLAASQCCGCGGGSLGGVNTGGRTLAVASQSAPPTGLAVQSDNAYEGCLQVGGKLPFLGSANVEACVPSQGCSKICYGCGCGNIGIREAGCNTGAGLRGCGCGCGGGLGGFGLGGSGFGGSGFGGSGFGSSGFGGSGFGGIGF